MAPQTFNFTTGPASQPGIGTLNYNGCIFSPLFETKVSGTAVKDEAQRTVKYMEYTITVDGYVTLPAGAVSIGPTMANLRQLLTDQGGSLRYEGRGFDLVVNAAGPGGVALRDVAWGPIPELLEFQPLGAGRSAKVQWQVKTRIPERVPANAGLIGGGLAAIPLLQFNYETVVSYGEDGYSTLSIRGVLEIPLTRQPSQKTRTLTQTADDMRSFIEKQIMPGIDLSRFRVTKREFTLSRDKRTLDWSFAAEEKPYMDLPLDCTIARGTYTVRPAKAGMGLTLWLCSLRATYTVRADRPRRIAWLNFLVLLRLRMAQSVASNLRDIEEKIGDVLRRLKSIKPARATTILDVFGNLSALRTQQKQLRELKALDLEIKSIGNDKVTQKAFLIDFSFDEGLYLDSKTTTFSATWRLVAPFNTILLASGLWIKTLEKDVGGKNLWATSMKNIGGTSIQGVQSWPPEIKADSNMDIIVDFGS